MVRRGALPPDNSPEGAAAAGTSSPLGPGAPAATIDPEGRRPSARTTVQGKPAARRGRKARDLPRETARPPVTRVHRLFHRKGDRIVKANLARFTWALTLLASLALTVGAGMRWN